MKKFLMSLVVLASVSSYAGECVMHVNREACLGKDAESYKKCDGKKECDEKTTATSDKDCTKKALKACENARFEITKSKTVSAKYEGKDVEGGKNFCAADRSDFNKCAK